MTPGRGARRRVTLYRVAASRWLSRWLLGREEMLCAWASWMRWRSRHLLNGMFLDRGHCDAAADWEAATAPDDMVEFRFTPAADVPAFRRGGLL